jgi:hypothetical protein
LESKEWENAFVDIRKLSKITYKINEIKTIQDTVKKEWGDEFLKGPCKLFYIYYILKSIYILINQAKKNEIAKKDISQFVFI